MTSRIAIAVARFNSKVTEGLHEGARKALLERGIDEDAIQTVYVEGAFELPLASKWLAESGRYDAVLALGAVVLGETDHYLHICTQAARGLMDVSLATSLPVSFGILTCRTGDQAYARSAPGPDNKGAEAAVAALEMIELRRCLQGPAD